MIVTIEWLKEWFDYFDHAYFGGKLPMPELGLTRARTRLGQFAYKKATRWGRTRLFDFKLSLSTYYDMTDRQAKNVLLHEMIHYVIAYTGLKDTSSHGIVFRGIADNLNRKHGWDIRIATSTKGWKVSEQMLRKKEKKGPQTYLMLAVETDEGKLFLSRVNPRFAHHLEQQLQGLRSVVNHQWYSTDQPFFEHYPQVRSLRGKRISKADYEHLKNVMSMVQMEG